MHPARTTTFEPGTQCRKKDGFTHYTIIGKTHGAGLSRNEQRVVYQSNVTGDIYHRTTYDFVARMEILP
jgi:hypothetical protein